MKCARTLFILFCALLVAGPVAAQRLYKYTDEQGRTRYTDRPPIDMSGRASIELNSQGTVVKRNAAALTAEEIAAQEEEARKKREAAALEREEKRKTRALLATYPSVQDIDDARERALANNAESIRQAKLRIADLDARRARVEKASEAYKGKELPADLKREAYEVDSNLRAQQSLLEAKQREVNEINARYDSDKKLYLEIIGASPSSAPNKSVANKAAP